MPPLRSAAASERATELPITGHEQLLSSLIDGRPAPRELSHQDGVGSSTLANAAASGGSAGDGRAV